MISSVHKGFPGKITEVGSHSSCGGLPDQRIKPEQYALWQVLYHWAWRPTGDMPKHTAKRQSPALVEPSGSWWIRKISSFWNNVDECLLSVMYFKNIRNGFSESGDKFVSWCQVSHTAPQVTCHNSLCWSSLFMLVYFIWWDWVCFSAML